MPATLGQIRQLYTSLYSDTLSPIQINDAVNWFGQLHNDGVDDATAGNAAIALVKSEGGVKLIAPEIKALQHPLVKRYAPAGY